MASARFCNGCGAQLSIAGAPSPAIGLWPLVALSGCVFLVSGILRVGFVLEVLNEYAKLPQHVQMSQRYGFLTPDSLSYLEPAAKAASGDLLHAGSLQRPPGYPVFLAMCGQSPSHMLIAQALLGSLIPIGTLLLTLYLSRNPPLSVVAALVSAFSPTGVGVTGLIMSDLLFSVLFAAGILSVLYAASKQQTGWILLPAFIFGLAALVRPVLFAWPLLSAVIWWLIRRSENQGLHWRPIIILVFVQSSFLVGWSTCNFVRDKVFTVSEMGLCTMRAYWAARVEEWARTGHIPSNKAVRQNHDGVMGRLFFGQLTPSQRLIAYRDESLQIFWSHPAETVIVLLRNIQENTINGWNYFPAQLPLNPLLQERGLQASRIESSVRMAARWPITLGFVPFLLVAKRRSTLEDRKLFLRVVALSVAYPYFALCSGVTFWTGPRILYPVEMLAITIATMEIHLMISLPRTVQLYLQHRRGGCAGPSTGGGHLSS